MLIFLSVYAVIAILVFAVARIIEDPYQHASAWADWAMAILFGIFWFPLLIYALCQIVYEELKGRFTR